MDKLHIFPKSIIYYKQLDLRRKFGKNKTKFVFLSVTDSVKRGLSKIVIHTVRWKIYTNIFNEVDKMPDIELNEFTGNCFEEVLKKLSPKINPVYYNDGTRSYLKRYITPKCKMVQVEFPYFDLEYLSSVYS